MRATATVKTAEEIRKEIDCALKEGIENIVLAVMGIDGLGFDEFVYELVPGVEDGVVSNYKVMAKVTDQIAQLTFKSIVPVRHPDNSFLLYHIDDVFFDVDAGVHRKYQAWCSPSHYDGGIAIVRCADDTPVTWLIAGTLDDTIIHIGPFSKIADRHRATIRKHWPNPESR
jgi:hypothetical protein